MTWRLARSQFKANQGDGNKRALRRIVRSGAEPGVLAYADGRPIGWCAVAPRQDFSFLERSRVLAPLDDLPVWSITCLFVAKEWRRRGLSTKLIEAAVKLARKHGARIVEAYPQDVKATLPAPFIWTGVTPAFKRAGFKVVARRSPLRPIMRLG